MIFSGLINLISSPKVNLIRRARVIAQAAAGQWVVAYTPLVILPNAFGCKANICIGGPAR
jgi:hypothetical protein